MINFDCSEGVSVNLRLAGFEGRPASASMSTTCPMTSSIQYCQSQADRCGEKRGVWPVHKIAAFGYDDEILLVFDSMKLGFLY